MDSDAQAMVLVFVACSDLLTSSRFMDENGVHVRVLRSQASVDAAAAAAAGVWIVDLPAFPNLPRVLRELHGPAAWTIGFAPHVDEGALAAGREWCDRVVARGAAVRAYASLAHAGAQALTERQD